MLSIRQFDPVLDHSIRDCQSCVQDLRAVQLIEVLEGKNLRLQQVVGTQFVPHTIDLLHGLDSHSATYVIRRHDTHFLCVSEQRSSPLHRLESGLCARCEQATHVHECCHVGRLICCCELHVL